MLLTSITKGMNFSVRGILLSLCFLSSKLVWQSFLSLLHPLQSSLALSLSFGMLSSLIAARASSAFIYFWAFSSILAIVFGGLLARAVTNSLNFNPALKVINCTLSSTSSTSRTSLVKHFTCDLRGSLSPCLMVSRWFTGLFWCYPPTKWHTKELPSCSKFSMDDITSLLNHTCATPLKVVWKEQHKISSGGCWRLKVILKVVIWSNGPFKLSNDSSCGRQNFGGREHSKTFVVKGESVLQTIPSKF